MVRAWVLATGLLLAGRGGMTLAERHARVHGTAGSPTLIVGAGRVGRLIARRLMEKPEVGLRPLAFADDDPRTAEVLSKVLLLAKDTEIKDPTILSQIMGSAR